MAIPSTQRPAGEFLTGLAGAAPIETHISAVFVGVDTVWKMKKAVRLPYLDFTSLAARRHFLNRELALNAPAAPGLYRDVVPLVRGQAGGLALNGPGEPLEWVLRMGRIPTSDFFDRIALAGKLTPALARQLGRAIARYHAGLVPLTGIDQPASLRRLVAENRASAIASGLAQPSVLAWEQTALGAIERRLDWLEMRAQTGFVRRAHGDLHLGNLCLWRGQPVPFDALEFDERLASIDLAYDLAFTLMDAELKAGRAAANQVLNGYCTESGDILMVGGLPLFLSLRAMVRAHVQAVRQAPDEARALLQAAHAFLAPPAPILVATGGLPGSGKSTLAHALASQFDPAPGALVLGSDVLRKRRHGVAPEVRLPDSAYTSEENLAVASALTANSAEVLGLGHAVIADATFADPALRTGIQGVAHAARVPFIGFWLEAPLDVLESRVDERGRAVTPDPSDATPSVVRRAAASLAAPPDAGWHRLPAQGSPKQILDAATVLARRLLPSTRCRLNGE